MSKNTIKSLLLWLAVAMASVVTAQNLPKQYHFSADGRRLMIGNTTPTGIFSLDSVRRVDLTFAQTNYWQLLTANYATKVKIPATLSYNGKVYPNVGVRFRGNTSYSRSNAQKKSFSIDLNFVDSTQEISGYETVHFNNAFEDPSFVREVTYLGYSRKHIPAAKGAFINLYINGENWGLYPVIQNLDGEFLSEWFLSNDGTFWRAERSTSGGGDPFGAGFCSLNYLSDDTTSYKPYYTLERTGVTNPWAVLPVATKAVNNISAATEDSLAKVFDTDRALWFLAHEIMFGDDDSYIAKGGMDYYVYWDKETNRVVPIEYDGNSCMKAAAASWSPFYNQSNVKFALLNKLLAVPSLRQRYLAHMRTLIEENLDPTATAAKVDAMYAMIESYVVADTKKNYTTAQFNSEKAVVKSFLANRRTNLLANAEVNRTYPTIANVAHSATAVPFTAPTSSQTVVVKANVTFAAGISKVTLYYGAGFEGTFSKTTMYDDGAHNDGAANDGVFAGVIPVFPTGTFVRYYIEALANDGNNTAAYMPKGAEHDVYVYQVQTGVSSTTSIAINEIMALNQSIVTDPNGQYEDWIEFFNKTNAPVDISGFHLTDDATRLSKWKFPANTVVPANGYLIVWADEDAAQPGLHANFKLSGTGETLIFSDRDSLIIERVDFGQQRIDYGYARRPNGTGAFVVQTPTFSANNNTGITSTAEPLLDKDVRIFPNPTTEGVTVQVNSNVPHKILIFNMLGQVVATDICQNEVFIDTAAWQRGIYMVKVGEVVKKISVQ